MKVYSIGRENGCDIVINDNSDVISRRHATLNVAPSGKMTIVDLSQNGTYVNGIRISQNVPVPVTRKDTVSFAHVTKLNWDLIPKPNAYIKYVAIGLIAVVLVVGGVFGYNSFSGNGDSETSTSLVTDSTKVKTEEQIKKEVQDSLNREKAKKDSIDRAKSKKQQKVKINNSSKGQKKDNKKPKSDNKKKEEKKTQYR